MRMFSGLSERQMSVFEWRYSKARVILAAQKAEWDDGRQPQKRALAGGGMDRRLSFNSSWLLDQFILWLTLLFILLFILSLTLLFTLLFALMLTLLLMLSLRLLFTLLLTLLLLSDVCETLILLFLLILILIQPSPFPVLILILTLLFNS